MAMAKTEGMTKQQRQWLDIVRVASEGGGEKAQRVDLLPKKIADWMYVSGYVHHYYPVNPSNRVRFVITPAGLRALDAERAAEVAPRHSKS
jgi:hypothetical protein